MNVYEELRDILISDTDVAALVGTRVYPMGLPEATSYVAESPDLPAIHYALVNGSEMTQAPISNDLWQFTVVGRTYVEVHAVVKAVKRCLHCYKAAGIPGIHLVSVVDMWDDETNMPYAPMTFKVKTTEFERS